MKAVYTAIIGAYDTLKEPTVITPGWGYICFTDQKHLRSNTWRIIQVDGMSQWKGTLSKLDPIRLARYIKILGYQLIVGNTIWVDGSFQIACDLNEWWQYCGAELADMVVIKHPMRNCVYAEGATCIRNKRGDQVEISEQLVHYRTEGIPEESQTLIQSGIIMRKNVTEVWYFCKKWWGEVERYSTRDQLGFVHAYWEMVDFVYIHIMQNFDYRTSNKFLFNKHLMKVLDHTDVLMYLATKFGAKSYLEIGVQNPNNNFNNIPVQFKIGVDPDPHANATFRGTSDEFFEQPTKPIFDLQFIDGLHHRDQVKRDFTNAYNNLSENGFIVIHDCNPKRQEITYIPRNGLRGEWTGDVYKFVAFELWEYPVNFVTLPFDQGICIVWKDKTVMGRTMTAQDTSWEYFHNHRKELLHIIDNIEEFDKLWN